MNEQSISQCLLCIQCTKLLPNGKTYGYGGHSLGIDPLSVSYVQPVQLVAAGGPIAAVPLGTGIGGYKNLKGHKGHINTGNLNPNVGLGLPPLNTYGTPPLGNSYGAPPLKLNGGSGFVPPHSPGPVLIPPPVQHVQPPPVQHVHHHLYDKNKPLSYSPPAPVYTKTPVYNPPPPVNNRPQLPVYNPPPPVNNRPLPPVYNPSYNPSQQIPVYSQPPASYSGINGRETCVCVPIQQCPSYDVIGRVSDYQLDPRNVKSNITAEDDDQLEKSRRRRQTLRHRRGDVQVTITEDSETDISSKTTTTDSPSVVVPSIIDVSTSTMDSHIPEENGKELEPSGVINLLTNSFKLIIQPS